MSAFHEYGAIDFLAIHNFRSMLPAHRIGWFDSLSFEDQTWLAWGAEDGADRADYRDEMRLTPADFQAWRTPRQGGGGGVE